MLSTLELGTNSCNDVDGGDRSTGVFDGVYGGCRCTCVIGKYSNEAYDDDNDFAGVKFDKAELNSQNRF